MDFTEIFANAFKLIIDTFAVGIPNLIKAILIFAIGYFISKSVTKLIQLILHKMGVDKLGEKLEEIDFISKSNIKIEISAIISKIIYVFMILIFLVAATDVLGLPALSNLVSKAIELVPNIIVAIGMLSFGIIGADMVRKLVLTTCDSLGVPSGKIIANFIFYFLFITVFLMALGQTNINTAFLERNISIIIGGAVLAFSIGYGLASKDVVANFLASGYSKDKLKIGDKVIIDNVTGVVTKLDNSIIEISNDNSKMIIPIHKLLKEKIEILN
ncbi:MAG TPA: mechanosensitive ion channel [Saprospiraceae bacterium]|nr:mechanosensitive ion channel [Saprospiraceae bacterium]